MAGNAERRIDVAIARGRERLLAAEPELARNADARATEKAGLAQERRIALYEAEIEQEIADYAQSQGIDEIDMLLRLGVDSDEEARELLALRRQQDEGDQGA
ncbi:hypothetical protein AKI39_21230 [Bordetella sp. H567]|uniref:hypothetical protein n=1 Tax=Bordetella sp. H567 TaxID=1697043 RepID=UPI00081C47F9|nr:hypothetical protein [Bordetella sp. H567]AOB32724.1 hypothetical protein AKI39_21230 [Bordetella sp. H567]